MKRSFTFKGRADAFCLDFFDRNRAEIFPEASYTFLSETGAFGSLAGYGRKFKLGNPDALVEYERRGEEATITVEASPLTFARCTAAILKHFKKQS